jgi:GTP pyrophosphokinase
MQTIDFITSKERRIRIASETLLVYAPLAARIGMYQMRDELQELSFAQIHSESRNYIISKLDELREVKQDIINKIIHDLELKIVNEDVPFKIYGREKKPYSIWNKMKRRNVDFDHLHDIMAFRVITHNVSDCYRVLGVINSNYNMIPGSFKDYISTPKENGYQSLHLSTLGPHNRKIEVQIRTQEMHQIAEFGLAAHWTYKEKSQKIKEPDSQWLEELITLFENSDDYSEALRNNHIHIAQDQVFCFTPDGDVFNLPIGATVLDFAYSIHSEVGNRCVSAKVNGVIATLRHKIENGDQVEISTDEESKPSPNWLQFVTTSKAKTSIKHFIRSEKRNEYSALGKAILYKFFASKNLEINDSILEKILKHFNKSTIEDLYVFVAEGLITRNDILKATYPSYQDEQNKNSNQIQKNSSKTHSLPIQGLVTGMAIHFASCCHPIPGDEIVGVINTGTGVTIHNRFCYNLKTISLNAQTSLDVCWKSSEKIGDKLYQSHIHIVMYNSSGSLASISNIIAKNNVNITNIKIIDREERFFKLSINIGIKNTEHLDTLLSSLRTSEKIIGVNRVDN